MTSPHGEPRDATRSRRSRSRFALVALALGAACLAMLACGGPDRPENAVATIPASPGDLAGANLLLVTLDTTRADHLGAYGRAEAATPAFDRLAREGILFENAVAPAPVTLPSHSSIMTGLYPLHHGVRANNVFQLEPERETLAEILRDSGYVTGAAVSAFVLDSQFGIDQGFLDYDDQMDLPAAELQVGIAQRRGDRTTDRAIAWMRERAGRRFFLWVHLYDPHEPRWAPPEYAERHDLLYDAEISFADAQVGRLLAALEELDLGAKTLVVVAGDHGEGLGQHDERAHASLIYHSTQHVPLAMRAGRRLGVGVRIDRWVSLVDILPTVLSLLGVRAPEGIDGQDLTQPGPADRVLPLETLQGLWDHGWAALLGVQEGAIKYIHGPPAELYDLARDPQEEVDQASARPRLVESMAGRLREFFGDDLERAAASEPTHRLDAEDLARLQALGYMAGGTAEPLPDLERPHPREMVPLLAKVEAALLAAEQGPEAMIEAIKRVVREHPDFPTAYRVLGFAAIRIGDFETAEAAFARQLELLPDDPSPLLSLASLRQRRGDPAGAIEVYRQILARWPDRFAAFAGLGRLYLDEGEDGRAIENLKRALELRRRDEAIPDLLADAMLRTGRVDEASEVLHSHLAAQPDLPMVSNALARILVVQGRHADAIALLERAIELAPDHYVLVNNLGYLLVSAPDPELYRPWKALALLERACEETGYRDPRYMHTLSMLLAQRLRLSEAVQMAERALTIAQSSQIPEFAALAEPIRKSLQTYRTLMVGPARPLPTAQSGAAPPAAGSGRR